ncbi:MAG: type II toxin-antitoxin system VapC family toxin [Thermosynechococcaceae cyanobacterium]
MIKTFIDSGVLIAAARGQGSTSLRAVEVLDDPNREFVSSPFLKLEVLPKAIYNQRKSEIQFYEAYFSAVDHYITDLKEILLKGDQEARQSGLGAMDALHIAAAFLAGQQSLSRLKSRINPFTEPEAFK